ncbi:hypothetical protein [Leptospira interrogans]|uniref:hypothetical protein n=1 Tax=Leptospira interrogans TaxID=173 RepID=UPI003990B5C2
MPLGVEHKETGLLSLAPAAVLNITLMPLGVEHQQTNAAAKHARSLNITLMPVGVEHPMIFKTTDQGTV